MKIKFIARLLLGFVLMFLGLLWLLQGSDIIHLQPILCFANCQPLTGKSPLWQAIGTITFIIGMILIGKNIKWKKHK